MSGPAQKECGHPGCTRMTKGGRKCQEHVGKATSDYTDEEFYSSTRWQSYVNVKLSRTKECEDCGKTAVAVVNKLSRAEAPALVTHPQNLKSLCEASAATKVIN